MKREISDFIKDMLDAIDDIEEFIEGLDFDTFQKDKKTIYSVIRAIEIIGEASKNIPDSVRKKNPNIPWKLIAGMRDKLIHGYFGVDLITLWKTAIKDAPQLRALILKIK